MKRTRTALLSLIALLLSSAFTTGFRSPDRFLGEAHPLIGESLTALTGLVAKENCVAHDAADDDIENGVELPFILCDDGLPPSGGGEAGIPVPAKYAFDANQNDWRGLPKPASDEETAEADGSDDLQPEDGNRITLDVDVTLPPSARVAAREMDVDVPTVKRPKKGFPVIVLMHGCCGGNKTSWEAPTVDTEREHWHHSSAWWASQGYVVITYTARGFRNSNDQGSTGTTQLDSRRYEINDYQYLVGLLADHDSERRAAGEKPLFDINPKRVGAVGGSYGGGFSWLALTDPSWKSPAFNRSIKLAAVVPKYGWTDLVEALVPSGHYRDTVTGDEQGTVIAPTKPADAPSRHPVGVMKQSIVAGLYGTGNNASGAHTTFPQYIHDAIVRLQQGEPYDDEQIETLVDTFLNDRSAYYQGSFWKSVKKGLEVPLFAVGTWTDPLFPTIETLRFYNKLKAVNPDYPVQAYFGDYQHFVANKAKEWGDLCGDDHHVCTIDDFRNSDGIINLGKAPTRVRKGINARINAFLDHFLKGKGKRPKMSVSATTTICAANATEKYPVDEPGPEFRAGNWRALTPQHFTFGWSGGGFVTNAAVDAHAVESDPVFRDRQANKCYTTSQTNPGLGVAHLASEPLARDMTLMGLPNLEMEYDTGDSEFWVSARLFDQDPEGNMTLVSRGLCKFNGDTDPDATCESFALLGNAWVFGKDHLVVVEISQSDSPFLRKTNAATSMTINSANIDLPLAPASRRHDFRD